MKTYSLVLCLLVAGAADGFAQDNQIILYPDSGRHEISRHIYGHFSEHLGRCIYGGFWVGENSKIPNSGRIRTDVVEALRDIDIPNLRWPGGCFADEYHWMDGIGLRDKRPTMINTHWGGVTEDNSFGTHEFLELCSLLDCEPVICGNMGSGTIREMSQWVEYLNSDNVSPMTNLRKENGQEQAFGVTYWGVGNENWDCGGRMTAEYYANELRRYSVYCKNYGENELYKVACGPSGDNYHWTETLMKDPQTRNSFHGLSLHYYTICHDWEKKGSATDFTEGEWFTTMQKTLKMDEYIGKHSEIMNKYDPEKTKGLIVDEWGNWHDVEPGSNPGFLYQQNTLRDALLAAVNFNIFNKHCDRVKMANIAQTINVLQSVILTKEDQIILTPTYYVFKLYKVHHDAILVPHRISSELYTVDYQSIPAIHTSCSKDENGMMHLTLTNLNPNKDINVECSVHGKESLKIIGGEMITGEEMNAFNDFGKPESVNIASFDDIEVEDNKLKITLPARSIVLIKVEI
ncbi:MAG: alpha-N-arabinofuranosidase [Bacteroidales bacterium]|nr:alpha-N-arabinofuranosidase [Bacteroidales bacterium]